MSEDSMHQKQERLERLQTKSQEVAEEIEQYYERLIQEFKRRYPPLSYVDELRLSHESMERWLARHSEGK